MFSFLRHLLTLLAVFAVGTMQVCGVPVGYHCACTGEETAQVDCEKVVCHPDATHADGCATDIEEDAEAHDDHESEPASSTDGGHKHNEVRASLEVTGSTTAVQLPAVVYVVLSPVFQLPEMSTMIAGASGPALPHDGSPPTPLLVARTMVMLV